MPLILLLIIPAGIIIYVWSMYNRFVTIKVRIGASVQEIGNQLKRQAGLIPNLEESAKAYLKHEKGIFKELAEARKAVDKAVASGKMKAIDEAANKISSLIPNIRAIMESNPQIKGAGVISRLMDELRDTADKVMYSRRTMIDLSADYNTLRQAFPSNIIANLFGFGEAKGLATSVAGEHLAVSGEELKTPKISL